MGLCGCLRGAAASCAAASVPKISMHYYVSRLGLKMRLVLGKLGLIMVFLVVSEIRVFIKVQILEYFSRKLP